MSDDPRYDVAIEAIRDTGYVLDPEVVDSLARNIVGALRAYDSVHSSDKTLGVRRWDVMAHESRLRQNFEFRVRTMPSGISELYVLRSDVLDILKGPIGG